MIPSKIWKIYPQKSPDLLEQLLLNRNIKSGREEFFNPDLKNYEKDLNIPGIAKSQKRIKEAIEKQELIVVFGDYDVDGVCASAILYKALTSIGAKVLPYIPHREKEGYGLSKLGLEFARDSGATLVITVDNGIVAIDQAKFAKEIGLDLIITDHHTKLDVLPEAYSLVHSTLMCGAGVAWCLIRDLIKKEEAQDLLEFVMLATIADLIPLTGVNRAFVVQGLKQINKTKNPGLLALMDEAGVKRGQISSFEIGYILGPRLNAIGRLGHAIDALRLLCTKDPLKAKNLARLCCETNSKRQELTATAVEEARLLIKKNLDKKIHILNSKDWAPGIIGLIAARVTEEYSRPAIAISVGESFSKGSARSINGLNIVETIRKASNLLIDIGGHSGAAGFSIANEKIEEFKIKMEEITIGLPDIVEPVLEIEAEVEKTKLNLKLAKDILKLEPFGMANPRPVLATKVMRVSDIRTVGQGKHLKFKADGINAIAFGMGSLAELLSSGQLIDIAYYLEIDRYDGMEKVQLKVKDLKLN